MSEAIFRMRKARTYGQVVNGTFIFVRAYKQIIFEAMWKVLLPLITVATICVALFINNLFVIWENPESTPDTRSIVVVIFSGLLVAFVFVIASLASYLIQYCIFGLAVEKGNDFTFKDVIDLAKKKFWGFLGLIIVAFIGSSVLSNIVSLPVIWIPIFGMFASIIISSFFTSIVYLAPVPMFVENQGFSKSIDRVIACVKGYAWKNAGVYATFAIIHVVLTISLLLPISLTVGLMYLYVPGFFDGDYKRYETLLMIIGCANIVMLSFGAFFFSIVPIVGMGLQYLNIVERREATSISIRVKQLLSALPPIVPAVVPEVQSENTTLVDNIEEAPAMESYQAESTVTENAPNFSDISEQPSDSTSSLTDNSTDSQNISKEDTE